MNRLPEVVGGLHLRWTISRGSAKTKGSSVSCGLVSKKLEAFNPRNIGTDVAFIHSFIRQMFAKSLLKTK